MHFAAPPARCVGNGRACKAVADGRHSRLVLGMVRASWQVAEARDCASYGSHGSAIGFTSSSVTRRLQRLTSVAIS